MSGFNDLLVRPLASLVPRGHMPGSYLDLVAAVIRSGLKHEGPEYLRTDGGLYWCGMGNLDPEAMLRLALQYPLPDEQTPATGDDRVQSDTLQPL